MLDKSCAGNVLDPNSPWTWLEIVIHIKDFQKIF